MAVTGWNARQYLVSAAGQVGAVTLPLKITDSPGRGNAATFVEVHYEVRPNGTVDLQLWIDGVPTEPRDLPSKHSQRS